MDRPKEHRKRDMWKNIPWKVRHEIEERINGMTDGIRKTICTLAFIDDMSTTDIASFCIDNGILSRNHKPYSRRRIQQIIAECIPEYNMFQKHTERAKKRAQHHKIREKLTKTFCGKCGCTENLELHHMTPLFLGGTDSDENLLWLCHECHSKVTKYQQQQWKEQWYKR